MPAFEEAARTLDVRGMIISSVVTALAFVVGLFWNDAIRSTIEQFVPQQQSLFIKYIVALVVTAVVIIVGFLLYHSQQVKIHDMMRLFRASQHQRNLKQLKQRIDAMKNMTEKEKRRLKRALERRI